MIWSAINSVILTVESGELTIAVNLLILFSTFLSFVILSLLFVIIFIMPQVVVHGADFVLVVIKVRCKGKSARIIALAKRWITIHNSIVKYDSVTGKLLAPEKKGRLCCTTAEQNALVGKHFKEERKNVTVRQGTLELDIVASTVRNRLDEAKRRHVYAGWCDSSSQRKKDGTAVREREHLREEPFSFMI